MHVEKVFASDAKFELAECLDEVHGFNVTDGAAQLDDANLGRFAAAVRWNSGHPLDRGDDVVGHVRDELHRLSQIISAPLFLDHFLEHFPRRDVVVLSKADSHESLIISEVKVNLAAIVEYVDLA